MDPVFFFGETADGIAEHHLFSIYAGKLATKLAVYEVQTNKQANTLQVADALREMIPAGDNKRARQRFDKRFENMGIQGLLRAHQQRNRQAIAQIRREKMDGIHDPEDDGQPDFITFLNDDKSYSLVRLTSMEHLQAESLALGHCVGTSDHYASLIRNGESEIFSIRRNDEPLMTLEYEVESRTVIQAEDKNYSVISHEQEDFAERMQALYAIQDLHAEPGRLPVQFEDIVELPKNQLLLNDGSFLPWDDPNLDSSRVICGELDLYSGKIPAGQVKQLTNLLEQAPIITTIHLGAQPSEVTRLLERIPSIAGSLRVYPSAEVSLPEGLTVHGNLQIFQHRPKQNIILPPGLTIDGYGFLSASEGDVKIQSSTTIGEYLTIIGYGVELAPDLTVGTTLDLRHSLAQNLPEGLVVPSILDLPRNNTMRKLPDNLVCGTLVVCNGIMSLAFGVNTRIGKIEGDLSHVRHIPDGFHIRGDLHLRGGFGKNKVTFGSGVRIGGNLYVKRGVDIPADCQIGGRIISGWREK